MAPDTASAETNRLPVTVELNGTKRPKLMKIVVSQSTRMISWGREIDVVACSNINQAEHEDGHGAHQPHPQLHGILGVRVQVMVRQDAADENAQQGSAKHAPEHDSRGGERVHGGLLLRLREERRKLVADAEPELVLLGWRRRP